MHACPVSTVCYRLRSACNVVLALVGGPLPPSRPFSGDVNMTPLNPLNLALGSGWF